jgi:hypothetical protein
MTIAALKNDHVYPPADRCIYCGDSRSKLGDEHVLPFALGGNSILPNACCEGCQKAVQKYEAYCLNHTFIQARTFLGLQSRNPKHQPKDLRLGAIKVAADGDTFPKLTNENFRWENIPVARHPSAIVVPVFARAGLLVGRPSEHGIFPIVSSSMRMLNGLPPSHHPTGEKAMTMFPFDPDAICRLAAKIAHGAAACELAQDEFEPMLTDIIRGSDVTVAELVGSSGRARKQTSPPLHHVEIFLKDQYVVATVQLFARYDIHPFEAVVGRATPKLLDRLKAK